MKDSKLASWIGYKEAVTWSRERLETCTNMFICPSHFLADKMIQGGFDKAKMRTLCNFIDVHKCRKDSYEKKTIIIALSVVCLTRKGLLHWWKPLVSCLIN